jgi:inner membrane protein
VDNITHAFLGAAMAECAVPRNASAGVRTAFMCAGVVAANAPDVDLLYNGIIEQPLGYLLHHRGHSHTLPGLGVLGLLIWSGVRLWPRARLAIRGAERRFAALIAAALAGHLIMDTANSYGTHLWYPMSSGWVYGDAVFVLEPWLWAVLGATLALNAVRPSWRVLIALLTLAPIGALVQVGLLQAGVCAVLAAVVGAAAALSRRWPPRARAAGVLAATAAIVVVMSGLSSVAKAEARRAIAGPAEVIDVIADANPGVPWCWAVMVLHEAEAPHDVLTATRATLSILPGVWPATSCASARLSAGWAADARTTDAVVWHRQWRIDVQALRTLHEGNCRARAWLQFGRVPYVANGTIVDLRFENPIGQNFTPMALDPAAERCPRYVTHWELPRRDVLEGTARLSQ